MRSATMLITFMVMALFYVLCDAAPPVANLSAALPGNFNSTDIGVSMLYGPDDVRSVPNLNKDVWKCKQRCYYPDWSEEWADVGGKHSQFVHDSVLHMCDVISAYVTSTGFKKDDTMSVCKPVDKGTEGKDYDRSIGVIITYRGPRDSFMTFDSNFCYNLLSGELDCGAGGEHIVGTGPVPRDFWEAKADPNRNNCADNGYVTIL